MCFLIKKQTTSYNLIFFVSSNNKINSNWTTSNSCTLVLKQTNNDKSNKQEKIIKTGKTKSNKPTMHPRV